MNRLANTTLRACALLPIGGTLQAIAERQDNLRKDAPAVRDRHGAAAEKEQPQVNPQGVARQQRQFGVPPKGNANFAWVQHYIPPGARRKHRRPPNVELMWTEPS
jgi:hypothetical protein